MGSPLTANARGEARDILVLIGFNINMCSPFEKVKRNWLCSKLNTYGDMN